MTYAQFAIELKKLGYRLKQGHPFQVLRDGYHVANVESGHRVYGGGEKYSFEDFIDFLTATELSR